MNPPAWWNLGIAATALQDWETAREAWSRYGIDVPDGSGPIEMDLGAVPIRVSPAQHPEVVWCRRIDPARAVVRSVPTAASGRGCGDTVLHDGAANGHRMHGGREVPVFDELELLAPGGLHTFAVKLIAPTRADLEAFESLSVDDELVVEDWASSIEWLCKKCSEGTPHEHAPQPSEEEVWKPERTVGVAARSEATGSIQDRRVDAGGIGSESRRSGMRSPANLASGGSLPRSRFSVCDPERAERVLVRMREARFA